MGYQENNTLFGKKEEGGGQFGGSVICDCCKVVYKFGENSYGKGMLPEKDNEFIYPKEKIYWVKVGINGTRVCDCCFRYIEEIVSERFEAVVLWGVVKMKKTQEEFEKSSSCYKKLAQDMDDKIKKILSSFEVNK